MRVGIAGLGKMGTAIAARLHECGEDLIVWNRSPQKAVATGLPVADTALQLAKMSDVVISSRFDEVAVRAVYCGDAGLIGAATGSCSSR